MIILDFKDIEFKEYNKYCLKQKVICLRQYH